jgi:hypothetical protein
MWHIILVTEKVATLRWVKLTKLTGKSGFSVEWLQTIHISCPSRSLWSGTCLMCDQKRESLWDAGQMRLWICRKTSVSSAIVSMTVICSTVAETHNKRKHIMKMNLLQKVRSIHSAGLLDVHVAFSELHVGRYYEIPWQTEHHLLGDIREAGSIAPSSVTEALYTALFCVLMARARYSLEQRVFIYDCYVIECCGLDWFGSG